MPLPTDEKLLELSKDLLAEFDAIFGMHPGFRPAHAKGVLVRGHFHPSERAKEISKAAHFAGPDVPVTVRFSNSTGLPLIPDGDANANPRGMAVRFHLGEHVHTDIVAHSVDGFPTRTGAEFLDFLKALAGSGPDVPSPKPIEQYVGSHPAALRFVQAPKPAPASFATEQFFGVSAMQFTNAAGESVFGRYRLVPNALSHLRDEEAHEKKPDYLMEELRHRVPAGAVRFAVQVQLAEADDVVDDATVAWPESRRCVTLGTLALNEMVAEDAEEQRTIIFDPIPRLEGIAPSDDPLLEVRAALYLMSGRRRRAAAPASAQPAG